MSQRGFSHIGLSTLDLDKTRDFYENILKFKPVRCDIIKVKEGGQIRHIFFDTGRDQLIAFMEARGVPGVPAQYDAGINQGLGVPNAFYHFAFEAGSEAGLDEKRNELLARGVDVTEVVEGGRRRQSTRAMARTGDPSAPSRRRGNAMNRQREAPI
jgi:catechol 2,3-dioxygenase-like lactoylglutathione lyase family enzyme